MVGYHLQLNYKKLGRNIMHSEECVQKEREGAMEGAGGTEERADQRVSLQEAREEANPCMVRKETICLILGTACFYFF